MIAAWHNAEEMGDEKKKSLHDKMSETMSEVAVSITITSATDMLSFAAGCITTITAVQGFCSFAAAAIVFNYVYMVYPKNVNENSNFSTVGDRKIWPPFNILYRT